MPPPNVHCGKVSRQVKAVSKSCSHVSIEDRPLQFGVAIAQWENASLVVILESPRRDVVALAETSDCSDGTSEKNWRGCPTHGLGALRDVRRCRSVWRVNARLPAGVDRRQHKGVHISAQLLSALFPPSTTCRMSGRVVECVSATGRTRFLLLRPAREPCACRCARAARNPLTSAERSGGICPPRVDRIHVREVTQIRSCNGSSRKQGGCCLKEVWERQALTLALMIPEEFSCFDGDILRNRYPCQLLKDRAHGTALCRLHSPDHFRKSDRPYPDIPALQETGLDPLTHS